MSCKWRLHDSPAETVGENSVLVPEQDRAPVTHSESMSSFFVARHGQDEDNANGILNGRRDRPLTEEGRRQARVLASLLTRSNIELVVTSPLVRAFETATIISEHIKVPVRVNTLLIERDFGILTGKDKQDIPLYSQELFQGENVLYFLDALGAEAFPAVYVRAERLLADLSKEYPASTILLVTHGDVGKMVQAAFYGWDWKDGLRTPNFGNCDVLPLPRRVGLRDDDNA